MWATGFPAPSPAPMRPLQTVMVPPERTTSPYATSGPGCSPAGCGRDEVGLVLHRDDGCAGAREAQGGEFAGAGQDCGGDAVVRRAAGPGEAVAVFQAGC